MGISIKKDIFMESFNLKSMNCIISSNAFVEYILDEEKFAQVTSKKSSNSIGTAYKVNLSMDTPHANIRFMSYSKEKLIKKYYDWAGSNEFCGCLKTTINGLEKDYHKSYEFGFHNHIYFVHNKLNIESPFAKTENELFEFFKEKEYYSFNSQKGIIEVVVSKPVLKIRLAKYLHFETKFEIGFELTIFGKKYTEDDLYYYNDRFFIQDVFDSKELLLDFKINNLKKQLSYFEQLKGNNPEGMVVQSKIFNLE